MGYYPARGSLNLLIYLKNIIFYNNKSVNKPTIRLTLHIIYKILLINK